MTWLGAAALACGGNTQLDSEPAVGGQVGGRVALGGASSQGTGGTNPMGGVSTSGTSSGTGGVATGGSSTGGSSTGGSSTGGSSTGGAHAGGAAPGGVGAGMGPGGAGAGGAIAGGNPAGGVVVGTGGAAPGGSSAGGAVGTGGATADCELGLRVDDCCSAPVPVAVTEFADPCLLPYRAFYTADELAGCPGAEACLALSCVHPRPPSHVVRRRNDLCVFVDECIPAAEPFSVCWVATDYNTCCSCPTVVPREVVERDPCVLTEGTPEPGTCADCSAVDCASCNTPTPRVSCEYDAGAGLSVCHGWVE